MARIGTVGYLNARPLSDRIDIDRHTLVLAHPAEVARMLRQGEVDVALVPVAAALADGDFRVVPGVCIGADGPVHSVLLVAETEPEQWTRVVLDGVSRTSRVLARLLLRHGPLAERVPSDLEIVDVDPGAAVAQAGDTTAALVIGDAARAVPERLSVRLDLAEQWKAWTGLPFVFAVWAGVPDLAPEVVSHLAEAGRAGIAAIPDGYAGEDLRYLTENLRYPLDDRALMGLRRFAALAHRHGLLPTERLELYGPGLRVLPRPSVDALLAEAVDGGRLSRDEALTVWRGARMLDLGTAADLRRRSQHGGDEVPWILEARLREGAEPSTLRPAVEAGASRVLLRGALDADRVHAVATAFPDLTLRSESPTADLSELAAAGLGAVESDDPAVLEVAIDAGLEAVATVAVGETDDASFVDALLALRALHDRTAGLSAVKVWAIFGDGPLASDGNTAQDHLRAVAFARLVLDGVPSLRSAPDTEGLGMAQASLRLGADHFGVVPLVGEPDRWTGYIATVEHQIREAGFEPVREAAPRLAPSPTPGAGHSAAV